VDDDALRQLFAAYQDGQLEAFERLYHALEGELKSFFSARCYDSGRVEDLLQETFLQIHRSRAGYLRGFPLRPWVYAIAKRVFLMHVRTVHRRESREATRFSREFEPVSAAQQDRVVSRVELGDALTQVSAGNRTAFLLHHWIGLSFREIGARLGIDHRAAKIRSSRAANQLRRLLQSEPSRSGD